MRLYHNPRCSKSRQAVDLLNQKGIEFEEYRYLDNGIAPEDFEALLALDGVLRTKDLGIGVTLDLQNKSDLRDLLSNHPKLLQRPILVKSGNAAIGRPLENILTLLREV